MERINAPGFDLATTLNSGQVFHWEKVSDGFCGAIGECAVYLEQRGDVLQIEMEGEAPRQARGLEPVETALRRHAGGEVKFALPPGAIVRDYFAFDHPLDQICASFPRDPVMNAAREFCRGLRIIRQPKWECLATFICSSMKQVAHIRQMSQALRRRFGKKKEIRGHEVFSFPPPQRLARTNESELRKCALGYRAKNLLATAKLVASKKVDLDSLTLLPDESLQARLCELPGVGAKVANCVMLFAYERIKAFPIDVWIERVLREKYYTRTRKVPSRILAQFAANYFGPHGGYAQQYLFHHARITGRRRLLQAPKRRAVRRK